MRFILLGAATVVLFILNLLTGAVHIDASTVWGVITGEITDGPEHYIILRSRLPQAVTALLSGASLSTAGLLLQTAFRNPLAGPSILGISSGASLGVAVVMLFFGGSVSAGALTLGGMGAVVAGAFAGSLAVMGLLLLLATLLRNDLMLLIAGIMTGYLASSVIMLLNFSASAAGVQSYVMWGMGSFGGVTVEQLPMFSLLCIGALLLSATLVKPLNLLLLGENYARNLGLDMGRARRSLLVVTGVLTATVAAWCGPVGFIGLAVPHIARLIHATDDHRALLPLTMLTGGAVALLCSLAAMLPESSVLPLNAVTPLVGVPVIIYVLLRRKG